jgi:hypothetical protein
VMCLSVRRGSVGCDIILVMLVLGNLLCNIPLTGPEVVNWWDLIMWKRDALWKTVSVGYL